MPFKSEVLMRVALVLCLMAFAFNCGFFHVSCVDPGFHIRTGELVWRTGSIPSVNTFSFAAAEHPWLLFQWLPTLIYYGIHEMWGVTGLVVTKAVLGALIFLVIFSASSSEAGRNSLWPFWTATAGLMMARVRFFERPYLFSELLMALLVLITLRHAGRRRWELLGLPLLLTFWANMYMGILHALHFLGLFVAGEWIRILGRMAVSRESGGGKREPGRGLGGRLLSLPTGILLGIGGAALTVSLVNPNGLRVLLAPLTYYTDSYWYGLIDEYHPPDSGLSTPIRAVLVLMLCLQMVLYRKLDPGMLLASLGFGMLALRSQRAVLMFVTVSTPYICRMLEEVAPLGMPILRRCQSILLPMLWLGLTCGVVVPDKTFLYGPGLFPRYYPLSIFEFMRRETPRQNLYNDMLFGGPVLWFLYPEFRPFADGRGEAYSLDFWKNTYAPVNEAAPEWKDIMKRHGIHGALVYQPSGCPPAPLAVALGSEPGWALVAFNDNALLYLERTEQNKTVIDQFEYTCLKPPEWRFEFSPDSRGKALEEAKRAVNEAPESLWARTALARSALDGGMYVEAEAGYRALAAEPGVPPSILRDHAYCLFMLGRLDEAARALGPLLRAGSDTGFVYYLLGHIMINKGRAVEALLYMEQAVRLDPHNAGYSNDLARFRDPAAR